MIATHLATAIEVVVEPTIVTTSALFQALEFTFRTHCFFFSGLNQLFNFLPSSWFKIRISFLMKIEIGQKYFGKMIFPDNNRIRIEQLFVLSALINVIVL